MLAVLQTTRTVVRVKDFHDAPPPEDSTPESPRRRRKTATALFSIVGIVAVLWVASDFINRNYTAWLVTTYAAIPLSVTLISSVIGVGIWVWMFRKWGGDFSPLAPAWASFFLVSLGFTGLALALLPLSKYNIAYLAENYCARPLLLGPGDVCQELILSSNGRSRGFLTYFDLLSAAIAVLTLAVGIFAAGVRWLDRRLGKMRAHLSGSP